METVNKFETESRYDSKHINNLCSRRVPTELLEELEKGCTIETLNKLAVGYPILRYRTQITIHGIFEEPKNHFVGGYKNLFRNGNRSLGVRWNAIDNGKRDKLSRYLRACQPGWKREKDSQHDVIIRSFGSSNKDEVITKYTELVLQAKRIDTSLFTGYVNTDTGGAWGWYHAELNLNVQSIPEENVIKLVSNITALTEEQIIEKEQELTARELARHEQWERECQEREERLKRAKEQESNNISQYIAENPLPAGYVKADNYQLEKGDTYVLCERESSYCADSPIVYKFYQVKKIGSTLRAQSIDKDGNNLSRHTESLRNKPANIWIKKAQKQTAAELISKGLTITEAGTGIFIGGDTYPHRKKLKELGGKWDGVKKAWYFEGENAKKAREYTTA